MQSNPLELAVLQVKIKPFCCLGLCMSEHCDRHNSCSISSSIRVCSVMAHWPCFSSALPHQTEKHEHLITARFWAQDSQKIRSRSFLVGVDDGFAIACEPSTCRWHSLIREKEGNMTTALLTSTLSRPLSCPWTTMPHKRLHMNKSEAGDDRS